MKIGTIGCHYRRDAGCYFENPKGLGCGFMALTKSPAVFVLNNKKISVPESSFIVFTPDSLKFLLHVLQLFCVSFL